MSMNPDKRRFLANLIGEKGVEAVEGALMAKSRSLEEAGVRWKAQRNHPANPFIALLHREGNAVTGRRSRDVVNGSRVAPFIADLRSLLKSQTVKVKW